MRRTAEDRILPLTAGLAGFALTAASAFCADLSADHMARLGSICGAQAPHCGWCYAAVAFGLAGASAFAAALRPLLRRGRA